MLSKVEKEMRRFITLRRMKELPKGMLRKAYEKLGYGSANKHGASGRK